MKKREIIKPASNSPTLNDLHIGRTNVITKKTLDDATSLTNEKRSASGDKLHRRNPLAVRQEIQSFDDLIPETSLADVQLSEMPGLQNTEQWKRIAARNISTSPPLSSEYYLNAARTSNAYNQQISHALRSSLRPSRVDDPQVQSSTLPWLILTTRRRVFFCLSIIAIIIAIVVAVVVAVILVRKPSQTTTDYYTGYVVVDADFDSALLLPLSTLAVNYRREFCSSISTLLSDAKTKYAIFSSSCTVTRFRNGSIISDFELGFTRYQNATRLNAFLNRTLIGRQLFGGTISSIIFNVSSNIDSKNNKSIDYDTDSELNSSSDSSGTDGEDTSTDKAIEATTNSTSIEEITTTLTLVTTTKIGLFLTSSTMNNSTSESPILP